MFRVDACIQHAADSFAHAYFIADGFPVINLFISGEIDCAALYGVFNCLLEQLLVPVDMGRQELAGRDFGFADDAFDQLHTSCTVAKVDIDHSRFPGKNAAEARVCCQSGEFFEGRL